MPARRSFCSWIVLEGRKQKPWREVPGRLSSLRLRGTSDNLTAYQLCVCMRARSVRSNSLRPCGAVVRQAPLSMGFSRQECWSALPFPPPGDLPEPGTETVSLASPALAGRFFTTGPPGKPLATSGVALGESLQLSEPQLLHQ